MAHSPKPGDLINQDDMDLIFNAVRDRQEKIPDEPAALSFYLVLRGIGERFRNIECVEQEWSGVKQDVVLGEGEPTCPNGHALNLGSGIAIGWVEVE